MIFDPLRVAPKTVALVQHRHMPIGKPRAFIEMTAGECTQPIEMRLDMAKQRIGQVNAEQIRQRRIGPVEIHTGCIRRKQSRLTRLMRSEARAWLAGAFATLVRSARGILDDIDHLRTKPATKPSNDDIRRKSHGGRLIASSAPRCPPTRSRCAPIFATKRIPHQWVLRNAASQAEFEKYARMPIIPLVVTPEGNGIQDSTPIIEAMEKLYPEPSIHPDDPSRGFISALIEEFGDEWGNKWMFHYRWARDVDQISSAGRIARMRGPKASEQEHAAFAGADPGSHGGSGVVRRLQRGDRAADRGRLSRYARPAGQASREPSLSVRRPARLSAISASGGRSTRCGPIRPQAR